MPPIKAIIVEDEKEGMKNLVFKLNKHCAEKVEIIAKCYHGEDAVKAIELHNPDLVFLDVRLGNMSGFDILNRLPHIQFEVIFTTAFNEYAIQAFKVSALDYLLKPIKPRELEAAVEKAKKRLDELGPVQRISVPISNGYRYIPVDEIVYCLADNTYTKIFLSDNNLPKKNPSERNMLLVTKTLKFIAQRLPMDKFCKISRSAYINIDYVDSFQRSNGGLVTMRNKAELSVSKDKRAEFLSRMAQ